MTGRGDGARGNGASSFRLRRLALALGAALAGASGLGLEAVLLSASGLALGYGGSTAIGLAVFLAAWSAGAYLSGRSPDDGRGNRRILALCIALALLSVPLVALVLAAGGALASSSFSGPLAVVAIAIAAALQGALLPLFARADARVAPRSNAHDIAWIFAANLAGSVLGALWIADAAVGAFGRHGAACCAGAAALAAGIVGVFAARETGETATLPNTPARSEVLPTTSASTALSFSRAALILGLATAWMSAIEWIGLRLGTLWLGGMQPALSAILCASILALALGAAVVPRAVASISSIAGAPRSVVLVLGLAALGSLWPLVASSAMHALAGGGDLVSADVNTALERIPLLVRALVLVGPSLLAFGGLVPVLHRALAPHEGDSGRRLGRLLLHESWGALLGIPLVHLVLVPHFGLHGALAGMLAVGAVTLFLTRPAAPWLAPALAVATSGAAVLAATRTPPALASPPLANPALRVLALREDRDFAVAVVDDGMAGERTLFTDGFRAAGTGREYRYMQALGHLPLLLHPSPRRVAVLALGTGTTLGAVSEHPEVERIDVLEISRAVVEEAGFFEEKNHGVLRADSSSIAGPTGASASSSRVTVKLGDGRKTLARTDGLYDVITMEPLLPDSPFAVYLYTREFYDRARRALAPGGLVCQWVPPHALEPETFASVLDAFGRSFAWSGAWLYGTQVVLVGGASAPELAASRFPGPGSALARALRDLGLATPADVLARWCGSCASVSSSSDSRALTDADPWIVFRPRRTGAVLLADLPRNLARLAAIDGPAAEPPASWLASAGPEAQMRRRGGRALRAARIAFGFDEARLRGAAVDPSADAVALDVALADARTFASRDAGGRDPELALLEDEIGFLRDLRAGVSALANDATIEGARAAFDPLYSAADRRKERADVHLYLAVALDRLGEATADKALDAALERCPRIALTPEGRRAERLGLSAARRARLEHAAQRFGN